MILILFFLGVLFVLWYVHETRAAKKRLPGPMHIPVLGTMVQVATTHPVGFIALAKLSKKYNSGAISIKLGFQEFIFVSSLDAINAFYNTDDCMNRPCSGVWRERNFDKELGIIFHNGRSWTEVRKFSTQSMRSVGFLNKEFLRDVLHSELHELVAHIDEEINSNPERIMKFTPSGVVKISFTNLICSVTNGKRHDYSDKKLQDLVCALDKFFRESTQGIALLAAYPVLKFFLGSVLGYDALMASAKGVQKYCCDLIEERRQTGVYKFGEPTCFIDAFLQKMEDAKTKDIYNEEQFISTVADFFTAGSETTANWFLFAVLLLTAHPDKQEKLYQELKQVIGDRLPEIDDKSKLIYTQATMYEVHRWCCVSVNVGPREAARDFEYNGALIKKGTPVLGNLYALYREDEDYWGDPHVFRPERFIGKDGQLTNLERFAVLFGAGKRICFGEVLAKDSAFMYLTTLFQTYEFKVADSGKKLNLDLMEGITTCPQDFTAKLIKRM